MTEIKLNYVASIFVNTNDIVPNATAYARLFSVLDGYIPIIINEMTPSGQTPRIVMEKQDEGIKILFLIGRIIIEKSTRDIESGDSLGSFEEFCAFSSSTFTSLMEQFSVMANRLSFVTKYLLKTESEKNFESVTSKLFHFPSGYNASNTFEWNWRMVKHKENEINGNQESMNYVSSINRVTIKLENQQQVEEFGALEVEFDLNTVAENTEMRFDQSTVVEFFYKAEAWRHDHYTNMMRFIQGS